MELKREREKRKKMDEYISARKNRMIKANIVKSQGQGGRKVQNRKVESDIILQNYTHAAVWKRRGQRRSAGPRRNREIASFSPFRQNGKGRNGVKG